MKLSAEMVRNIGPWCSPERMRHLSRFLVLCCSVASAGSDRRSRRTRQRAAARQEQTNINVKIHLGTIIRVARWYIFKPKITIWVNLGGPLNGKCWYFYATLEYVLAIWYILWSFGNSVVICLIFPHLCVNKNLATLTIMHEHLKHFLHTFKHEGQKWQKIFDSVHIFSQHFFTKHIFSKNTFCTKN
jgi:hypothetical protein